MCNKCCYPDTSGGTALCRNCLNEERRRLEHGECDRCGSIRDRCDCDSLEMSNFVGHYTVAVPVSDGIRRMIIERREFARLPSGEVVGDALSSTVVYDSGVEYPASVHEDGHDRWRDGYHACLRWHKLHANQVDHYYSLIFPPLTDAASR